MIHLNTNDMNTKMNKKTLSVYDINAFYAH